MTKTYLIFGIALVLLIAGAVFVREKKQGAITPAPIAQPPIETPTPPIVAPPITPTTDTIKDFSQAKEDCKNEQCQKIINEFQKFIDAPLVDTTGWNVYENKEHTFSFKYPKNWIKMESKNKYRIGMALFSPETYNLYYHTEGVTDGSSDLGFWIEKNALLNLDIQKVVPDILFGPYKLESIDISNLLILNRVGIGDGSIEISIDNIYNFSFPFGIESNILYTIKTIINSLELES